MARLNVTERFHGVSFPGHMHTEKSLEWALRFPFQETDVIIASYPKSGTTWMQEIVTLITRRGDPHLSQTLENWVRAPWLEQNYCAAVLEASSLETRLFTTHLPYHVLGPALQGSKARVIYVSRNPKDVCVSYFHFHKMANFLPEPGLFQDFLNGFLGGTLHYGSWFDHVKGWTSQTPSTINFLHITYEEMSLDVRSCIKQISSFLGCSLTAEEVNSCVQHCSFSTMKNNAKINYTQIPEEILDHSRGSFFRKGEVGNWKSTFTVEQSDHFDSVCKRQDCSPERREKPVEEQGNSKGTSPNLHSA